MNISRQNAFDSENIELIRALDVPFVKSVPRIVQIVYAGCQEILRIILTRRQAMNFHFDEQEGGLQGLQARKYFLRNIN